MSPDKTMAVAIAKDVVAQLDKPSVQTMRVMDGSSFFCSGYQVPEDRRQGDLRDILPDLLATQGCTVCALGAALISKARLFDNVPVAPLMMSSRFSTLPENGYLDIRQEHVYELLGSAFSHETLVMIESAFEGRYMHRGVPYTSKFDDAVSFGEQFLHADERLRAIMNNVIENDGDFKP